MNLNSMIASRANPGKVIWSLERHFADVRSEEKMPGWFDLQCRDDSGRLRLVVRYQWWPAGWKYFVLPVRHRPRRAWAPHRVTYHRDGSYSVAA